MDDYVDGDVNIDWSNKIFYGKYFLIEKLGFGSYASVWLSFCINDKKFYAIKIHNNNDYSFGIKETKIYNILQEKINKTYIVSMKEAFDEKCNDKIHHCEVLDLMGYSLFNVLEQNENGLPLKQTINISIKVLHCLYEFHKNKFIHGDVKPENILLNVYQKKIIDIIKNFDLDVFKLRSIKQNTTIDKLSYTESSDEQILINPEKYSDENSDEDTNKNTDENSDDIIINNDVELKLCDVGFTIINSKLRKHIQTAYYKAPEILLGLPYDHTIDIWAFGCMFYELLTGTILFDVDTNIIQSNDERYHLFMMTEKLGYFPLKLIERCPYKNIYFTHDMKKIKGFDDIDTNNSLYENIKKLNQYNKKQKDLICSIFEHIFTYDPSERSSTTTIINQLMELNKI
jgi:serine/threonine protein kinase